MVAISDKFGRPSGSNSYAEATTVKADRAVNGTVLSAYDLSDYDATAPLFFITYRKTTDPTTGDVIITNQTGWKAIVNLDNNTLTNLTLAPGYTDIGNLQGDFIEPIPSSFWANSLIDGVTTSINADGTLKVTAVKTTLGNETISEAFGEGVVSGLVWTFSTLNGSMTAGAVYLGAKRVAVNATTKTFSASKDTYVFVTPTGTVEYVEVANNAAQPNPTTAGSLLIQLVKASTTVFNSVEKNRGIVKPANVDKSQRHTLYRYWSDPNTGVVYSPGDGNYIPDAIGSQVGITFGATSATITKSAVYVIASSIYVVDVAQAIRPYFDIVYPAGWQGTTAPLNGSMGYMAGQPLNQVPVSNYIDYSRTIYLPAGTEVTARYTHRGSQNTRVGGIRSLGYWYIEEIL